MTKVYSDDSSSHAISIADNGDYIDITNSTTTPLLANTTFTGQWFDASNFSQIAINVNSDVDGAGLNAIIIEFSTDKVNVDHIHNYALVANLGEHVQVHVHAQYYRVKINNGPVDQTFLRVQTILRPLFVGGTVIEVDDEVTRYDDCLLTKSVVTGKTPSEVNPRYVDVLVNTNGSLRTTFDPSALDAFARLRVSNPYTLFESQMRYQDNGKWDTQLVGGGTAVHQPNESAINLSVTTASGDSVLRETKTVSHYQPGKSLLVLMTYCFAPAQVGLTQRIGYYGAQNGAYLELVDNTLNVVLRSYTTGALVETRIPQSSWDRDRLDGTGPSGVTLDPTKAQILFLDFEWLGVGRVHFGFVIDGEFILAHSKEHANLLGTTYMTTACLPCRVEIFTTGVIGTAATMKQICAAVMSEGGYQPVTHPHSAGTGTTPKTIAAANIFQPIISIRLAAGRTDAIVIPSSFTGIISGTSVGAYKVVLNPTLTGATWAGLSSSGNVEIDTAATSYTGGIEGQIELIAGTGSGSNAAGAAEIGVNDFATQLGRKIDGTADIICIVATADTVGTSFYGQLHWREVL